MPPKRILILGGTGDARTLAALLVEAGHGVTTSLAGVTEQPILPDGKIRIGGFGGADGLRDYLRVEKFDVVVDATHPFAAMISRNAAQACEHVPLLRLERPAWVQQEGDRWIEVADIPSAAAALPAQAKVLLTIGRKEILPFITRADLSGVARMIEPPPSPLPLAWELMLQRPPFTEAGEGALLRQHAITHLVSKNAGGAETEAKLIAARHLQIPVIMISRPAKPAVPSFASPQAIVAAVSQLGRQKG